MIGKILLFTLFAVSQAAPSEPWWIRLFFPDVSFTGKYHPSNYKVEKSPFLPDYVQNSNDVWSPAYWMPYKLAYSQYWVDLIENTTKAEQEKESQAQLGQPGLGNQNDKNTENNSMNDQYNQVDKHEQYGKNGNEQYNHNGQEGSNGKLDETNESENDRQKSKYNVNSGETIVQEANSIAQEVQTQAENLNNDVGQIISQAFQDAQKQMEAIDIDANIKKEEVAAEAEWISNQADTLISQIDEAAEAKKEEIAEEVAQFAADVESQFAPLYQEAERIAEEAAEIAEEVKLQPLV